MKLSSGFHAARSSQSRGRAHRELLGLPGRNNSGADLAMLAMGAGQ